MHSLTKQQLTERGLRNYWGYNPIDFFAPAARYSSGSPRQEFRDMADAIHDAGIEVLIDVVYNHTGETDTFGPTVSFRGIDNLGYYRTEPGEPGAVHQRHRLWEHDQRRPPPSFSALVLDSLALLDYGDGRRRVSLRPCNDRRTNRGRIRQRTPVASGDIAI